MWPIEASTCNEVGRDCSVGRATRYGLVGPGIESRLGAGIFRIRSDRSWGTTSLLYRGADKSLARPGRKQAASVRSVMDRGMDLFGKGRDRWWALVNVVMNLQVP